LLDAAVEGAHDIPAYVGIFIQENVAAGDDQIAFDDTAHQGIAIPDDDIASRSAPGFQGCVAVEDDQVSIQLLILRKCIVLIPDDDAVIRSLTGSRHPRDGKHENSQDEQRQPA
jgi:hypothetical protein